jgi:hypothetical protein
MSGALFGITNIILCSMRNKSGEGNTDCAMLRREPLEEFILEQSNEEKRKNKREDERELAGLNAELKKV